MPEDGSLRPRPMRRLVIAIARAVALFILVTGIYGALTIALPQWPVLNRSIAALLAGVTIFEMLRPARRAVVAAPPETPVLDNSLELAEARNTIQLLRDELERARDRESEVRSEYERESEHLQRAATRALEEIQQQRGQLDAERGKSAASQQELEAMRADRQRVARELEVARQKVEVDKTKLADLQREVDLTHATSQKVLQANETLKKQFDDERQRLQAELQRVANESKAERDRMQAEARSVGTRLNELIAQLERERKLSQELGATRARLDEENAALKKARDASASETESLRQRIARFEASTTETESLRRRLTEIEREHAAQVETSTAEAEALRQHAAQLEREHKSVLERVEAEWSAKLQKIVAGLAADHENDLGEAIGEREAARAELRSVQQQLSAAQRELKEARERDAATHSQMQQLLGSVQRQTAEREDSQQQLADARAEIESLQKQVEVAVQERERALKQLDDDWSAKLQKIVNGLTADHENDIGEAIAKREEARAEVRSLNLRIGKLEDQNEQLKHQLESSVTMPMPAFVDEKALREKIDAEWSAKLQTIVSHIASDHEADVGKAIEEREAARAELRNLNIKITSLQQKLEAERQARESQQARLRELEDQLRSLPTQPMAALPDPFPVEAPKPHEEQRARADVLEFAEQAFEALKRATSPGTVPVPAVEGKRVRILIVHHDPRFRAMWRDYLEKSGFDVHAAADGLEGLRVVKTEKPAAVIADVAMPKMDGRELCQMIKSNPETAEVKVILLSGMYTNDMPLPGEKSEFEPDELLRKPVKLDAMKAALTNVLAARAAS